jgi:hypothetical protein
MKRNKNQKPIFTSFNRRVINRSLDVNSHISPKDQLHGGNLFHADMSELRLLDDNDNIVLNTFDSDKEINNNPDHFSGLRLSSDFYDFGDVLIDTFEEFYLIIFNENNTSCTLNEITGLPANGFTLYQSPLLPATIPPKGSQFLRVLFSPETEGGKTSILSLTMDSHQRYTLQVKLTGTAVKNYFLVFGSLQGHGFGKMGGWVNLGRGQVCPSCTTGEVTRVTPHFWMRLLPWAGHFACRQCGARFLTFYKWGKVLSQGQNMLSL